MLVIGYFLNLLLSMAQSFWSIFKFLLTSAETCSQKWYHTDFGFGKDHQQVIWTSSTNVVNISRPFIINTHHFQGQENVIFIVFFVVSSLKNKLATGFNWLQTLQKKHFPREQTSVRLSLFRDFLVILSDLNKRNSVRKQMKRLFSEKALKWIQ